MVADPPPEIATNVEWRAIMVRARKAYNGEGLTQSELAAKIGTSQNMISLIESGEVGSSQFIIPICDKLGIPPPMHFQSEEQKTWSELGHVLRHKSMKKFRRAMALVEAMVEDEDEDQKPSKAANDEASKPAVRK